MPDESNNKPEYQSIADIIKSLNKVQTTRHPSIDTYLGIDKYFGELNRATKLIRGYTDGSTEYDIARMKDDLLLLSAIHVSVAEAVGYVQGYARRTEDSRKINKSRQALMIKEKRDEIERSTDISIKVTDPDVDNGSRILAEEFYLEAADAEIVSQMMRSMWYAIGDFIKVLNSAINRSHQELFRQT